MKHLEKKLVEQTEEYEQKLRRRDGEHEEDTNLIPMLQNDVDRLTQDRFVASLRWN